MATKIKLMRLGKKREPHYRVIIADARTKRNGRAIETIGEYHPKSDPSIIRVDGERVAYWLGVGAQPTEAVAAILRVTGDWQKFAGEPAPEPMKLPAAKPDRQALFNAALAETSGEPEAAATTPRRKVAKPPAKPKDDAAKEEPTKDEPTKDVPAAEPQQAAASDAEPTESTAG